MLFPKDLAAVLAGGANGGRSAFYDDIAKSIVQKSEPCSGVFTSDDFVDHQSRWEEPLCANYRDFEIYVPPANSHGLLLLWLKILADYDLAKYGHNSPEWRCR